MNAEQSGETESMNNQIRPTDSLLADGDIPLKRIMDFLPYGIFVTDEKGKYLEVNGEACRITGYTEAELLGKTLFDLLPNDVLPLGGDHFRRLQKKGRAYGESAFFHRSGEQRFWSVNAVRIGSNRYLGIVEDITERNLVHKNLRESVSMFRSITENTFDLVSLIDLEGRYIYCNPSYSEILGYPAEDMVGRSAFSIVHPDEQAKIRQFFAEKLASGERTARIRLRLICADGGVKVMDHRAKLIEDENHLPQKILVLASDLTGLTEAETALKASQQQLERIINSVDDVLYSVDGQSGEFVFISPAFQRLLGYSREDIEEMGGRVAFLSQVIADGQFEPQQKAFEQLHAREISLPPVWESWWRCKDGSLICLEDRSLPEYKDGKLLLVQGILRDVSDRKAAEAERKKLEEELRQSQKMESVGRLAGGVAHDFNNMLGVILGHAEMALEQLREDDRLFADLEEIQKAAQRSADLTRQLLAFARKQTIRPKVLDLNQTIAGMLKMLKRLIGEHVHLIWKPGESLWRVFMDPSQMDQILANMAANARDAVGNAGEWTLQTGNISLDEDYCQRHPQCLPGDFVLLSISDTGCGMDEEVIEHVFEPFFTTKAMGRGTGLGLATIYGIIHQNKGFITVYSELNLGTTFNIYLPRYRKEAPRKTGMDAVPPRGGSETILLVEDEAAILKLGQTILERLGYRVIAATTPAEVLAFADDVILGVDLLIADVVMPEMNGIELFRHLAAKNNALRCLFISGYGTDISAQLGVDVKRDHYLQKPFSVQELAGQVRGILESPLERTDG